MSDARAALLAPGWLEPFLDREDGFARVRWKEVTSFLVERLPAAELHEAFNAAAREWVLALVDGPRSAYRVHESQHFLLLSPPQTEVAPRGRLAKWLLPAERDEAELLLQFAERSRRRILEELLPGIASAWGRGKHVVLRFENLDEYYSYIAPFYPRQGNFAGSGGVFLGLGSGTPHHGYGHFVLASRRREHGQPVLAHELTHNLLAMLTLPLWVDEGLATNAEATLTDGQALRVTPEDLAEHRATWSGGGIQDFWSGVAFHAPDQTCRLAYQLAQMGVRALSRDPARFRAFALAAQASDGGEAAFGAAFGGGLDSLVEQMLGAGDWAPRPDAWKTPWDPEVELEPAGEAPSIAADDAQREQELADDGRA